MEISKQGHASQAPFLIVVVGPTASGKSELAVRFAELTDGEIVSADSVQVYRHFEIGTGKPSAEQRARAPHHLLDVAEPLETLDAAQWARQAEAAVLDIWSRGKQPIVCGGTFLWVKALLYGLAEAPAADTQLRERYRAFAEAEGRPALHAELARVDPASAARLNPNDFVRVSRALEVYELTGKPLSEHQKSHGFQQLRFPSRLVGVKREKSELDQRIRARAVEMLGAGWLDEVRSLIAQGYAQARAMQSVGYRQVYEVVTNASPSEPLLEAVVRATRIFARRQRTWLREQPVDWLDTNDPNHAANWLAQLDHN